jgi:hypothetical protein
MCSPAVPNRGDKAHCCRAEQIVLRQGFASGDCTRDGAAVQRFVSKGLPLALSQSYAKNMGMYGQRVGAFSVLCDNAKEAAAVESQIKAVARAMYSNPPCHGAYLVHEILSDSALKNQWCALAAFSVNDLEGAVMPARRSSWAASTLSCRLRVIMRVCDLVRFCNEAPRLSIFGRLGEPCFVHSLCSSTTTRRSSVWTSRLVHHGMNIARVGQ